MIAGRLLVSGLCVLVAALVMWLLRRPLAAPKAVPAQLFAAMALLALVWTPRLWRDIGVVIFLFLAIAAVVPMNVIVAVVMLALAGMAYWGLTMVPGGGVALILCGVAVAAFFVVRGHLQVMGRLSRAAGLRPGQRPSGEVAVTGKLHGEARGETPAVVPAEAVLWRIDGAKVKLGSEAPVEVHTPEGVCVVEPRGARLRLIQRKRLEHRDLRALGGRPDKGDQVDVLFAKEGDTVCVIGTPAWGPSVRGVGLYRESPMVPVFRAPSALLYGGKSEADLHKASLAALVTWLAWGAVAATIATMQLAGLA